MKDSEDHILDQFKEEPTVPWFQHRVVVYGPIVIFGIGAIFRLMHWPFAQSTMATALMMILMRSLFLFFSQKRPLDEWVYFLGRFSLITALAVDFAFFKVPKPAMFAALALFSIGGLMFILKKKKPEDENQDSLEEDY